MLMVISPAKTLDFDSPLPPHEPGQPAFLKESARLIKTLRGLSVQDVASLMSLSDKLAALNVARYQDWQTPFTPENARAALYAFKGDVYIGLAARQLTPDDIAYAQEHLRILSGLYGLLRPLDLIQPYRLEMGTGLATARGNDLYAFWGERISKALKEAMAGQGDKVLLNLASQEYFGAVQPRRLGGRVVSPRFLDQKHGEYKIISFYAKKARGLMAAWIIRNRINTVADLRAFDVEGYAYQPGQSQDDMPVFSRKEQ
jgi:cytoplasmic iron level regulating protein YaaA (DUF328/UPF0246 family)